MEKNMCNNCDEIQGKISLIFESINEINEELDRLRPARIHERRVIELMKELETFDLGLRLEEGKGYFALFKDNVAISGNHNAFSFCEWLSHRLLLLRNAHGTGKIKEKDKKHAITLINSCEKRNFDFVSYKKRFQPRIKTIG